MKKEEYIDSVIKQIKNSRAKAEIKAELISHLEDELNFIPTAVTHMTKPVIKALKKWVQLPSLQFKWINFIPQNLIRR